MERQMRHKISLNELASYLIATSIERNPRFENLNYNQKDILIATAISDMQPDRVPVICGVEVGNTEAIDDVVCSAHFISKLMDAIKEQNTGDRRVLARELGEMIIEGAIKHCKPKVDEALDNAISQLTIKRQFNDAREQIIADNAQRTRDISLALRGIL
jgi:hypothetical protein